MKSQSSTSAKPIYVNKSSLHRLQEIALVENLSIKKMLEKIVMNYVPVPAIMNEGEFRYINQWEIKPLRKIKPDCIVVSVFWNSKLGISYKTWKEWKQGILSWEEFRRKYIERLMLPDAQEEIQRLRQLKKSQDIYITSWESDEEHSMRKIFVDLVNGKLVWT